MILKYPRDLCEYPQFNKLLNLTSSRAEARWILSEWWDFLGYCCSITGVAGVCPKDLADTFRDRYDDWFDADPIAKLEEAGWVKDEGDVFWCSVWQRFNYDLDVDFVEQSAVRRRITEWQKQIEQIEDKSSNTVENFPAEWLNVTDEPCDKKEMNRAVILVLTLDSITGRASDRGRNDWSRGTITTAVLITRAYPPWKMKAVLRAAWFARQRHEFPQNTEFILANWESVVANVMPSEGWAKYRDRTMFERSTYAESEKL